MRGKIVYRPIGVIHSEHVEKEKTPIQPVFAKGCRGKIEVFPRFAKGLRDVEGFSHVYIIYHLHRSGKPKLKVKPFLQDKEHGIFATRAPARPNPIGLSIVEVVKREGNILYINGVDVLDGTPLLDIKPYVSRFDCIKTKRNGWQDEVDDESAIKIGIRGWKKKANS